MSALTGDQRPNKGLLWATCQARKETKRKGLIIGAQFMKVKEVINVTSFKEEVKEVINVHCSIRVCAREHTHTHRGTETERERHVCLDTPHTQHSLWPHEQYKQNIRGCDPLVLYPLLTVILNLPQGIYHRCPISGIKKRRQTQGNFFWDKLATISMREMMGCIIPRTSREKVNYASW